MKPFRSQRFSRFVPIAVVVTSVALIAACGSSSTAARRGDVTATEVWARSTPSLATNAAVYMTLSSGSDDTFTGATVDPTIAKTVVLHVTDTSGSMDMDPTAAIPITSGTATELVPGKAHAMLEGLRHPLKAGESFHMTLFFQYSPDRTVTVTVKD